MINLSFTSTMEIAANISRLKQAVETTVGPFYKTDITVKKFNLMKKTANIG